MNPSQNPFSFDPKAFRRRRCGTDPPTAMGSLGVNPLGIVTFVETIERMGDTLNWTRSPRPYLKTYIVEFRIRAQWFRVDTAWAPAVLSLPLAAWYKKRRIPTIKITRIQSPKRAAVTLSFTDPFGPPQSSDGGGPSTPQPTMTSQELDHHQHLAGSQTPHDITNSANSTPTSKSAFIELQQHGYGPFKGYQHPHHFGSPVGAGQQNPHEASGFPSPRSLGYPFPPMHQNTYGYHLGSYAPQCASPPKDGKYSNHFHLDPSTLQ
ncbi:Homeotic protein distal-less [Eumeta japonica]|uniref:Homeotic protein distal-less n=1 Tax=Eumeta variegata TaxID=151549 RepID=A0A4C1UV82_EUMVA|nr:Homeotic protein distal-less [Eumeta japonica]